MFGSKKASTERQDYTKHPFLLSIDETTGALQTDIETGLSAVRVQEAQRKYGPNKLEGEGGVKWYSLLLKQISNAMILVRDHHSTQR